MRTRSGWLVRAVTGLVVVPSAAAAQDVGAQDVVSSARARVEIAEGGDSATVRVSYVLHPSPERTGVDLRLLGLEAGPSPAVFDGSGRPVALAAASGTRLGATVPVEGGEVSIDFTYTVAVDRDGALVRLPILTAALPPRTGEGDVFSVALTVPEGWVITESFPSGLRQGAAGAYEAALPVVPSLLSFRVRTDGAWRPSLGLLLELLGAVVLLAFGVVGRRHLARAAS